jgi:hypothetical protein
MQTQAIAIPEVQGFAQKARFFREGEANLVEISFVGSKDTVVKKVSPVEMAQFRDDWDAFCDGRPVERRKGTPLTAIMPSETAERYIGRNVHSLEEVAQLSDAQCQGLGHGTLTHRQTAIRFLAARKAEEAARQRDAISEGAATLTSAVEAKVAQSSGEIAELKDQIAKLSELVSTLVAITGPVELPNGNRVAPVKLVDGTWTEQPATLPVAKRRPGRPKKAAALPPEPAADDGDSGDDPDED